MRPDRCCEEEPPGVPDAAPPEDLGWAGDGPADGGPLLLGVKMSLVSSSPSCLLEEAALLWVLFILARYVDEAGLNPLAYICVSVAEIEESIVLVRLPLMAGRDIEANGLGVSGGENGLCKSSSIGGDNGVFGNGFSRLRSLVLRACFFIRRGRSEPADAGAESGFAELDASPVWIFEGL